MKKINENGRSMVEMLGVLANIGVLSVGGIAGYSKAMNKYKINKTTDQVSMLVANIRTLFSSQGNYGDLSNAKAITFGVVPNDMYKSGEGADGKTITNAFGGNVTILAAKARAGDDSSNEAFVIEYSGLSSEACVTVSTGDWGSGQASGLVGMAAGVQEAAGTDADVGTIGGLISADVIIDGDVSEAKAGSVIAQPGGDYPTPIKVTDAVTACSGADNAGSGYAVAWKYF